MKLAAAIGLNVAKAEIGNVEGIDYLLVERYDRKLSPLSLAAPASCNASIRKTSVRHSTSFPKTSIRMKVDRLSSNALSFCVRFQHRPSVTCKECSMQ